MATSQKAGLTLNKVFNKWTSTFSYTTTSIWINIRSFKKSSLSSNVAQSNPILKGKIHSLISAPH